MSGGAHGEHTFVFADLAGFTALTEAHGDERAADVAVEFCGGIAGLLGADAEDLKMLGDACLLRVGTAADAVALGLAITSELAERHGFPDVRVGMNTGPAARRGTEWFGATINIAARVAAVAGPHEVLLTAATHDDAGPLAGVDLVDRGRHTLRHVAAPVRLYAAHHHSGGGTVSEGWVVDPVCRMRLDPERSATRLREGAATVFFCSPTCAATYQRAPHRYRAHAAPDR